MALRSKAASAPRIWKRIVKVGLPRGGKCGGGVIIRGRDLPVAVRRAIRAKHVAK